MEVTITNTTDKCIFMQIAPRAESIKFANFIADVGLKIMELRVNYLCNQSTLIIYKQPNVDMGKTLDYLIKSFSNYEQR